jgi:hypothetical protein
MAVKATRLTALQIVPVETLPIPPTPPITTTLKVAPIHHLFALL